MGRSLLIVLLVMGSAVLNAQKIIRKSVFYPRTSYIFIDTEDCFKVELSTSDSKEIEVQAKMDGEYKDDLLVKIENNGDTVEISAGFQPNHIQPNDKLSAHKIISISLQVHIPADMNVGLLGSNSNVYIKGDFKKIQVSLDDGNCSLDEFGGRAQVLTRSGDIHVNSKGATIKTKNSFGCIEGNSIPKGDDFFDLTTITGDIHLLKTE